MRDDEVGGTPFDPVLFWKTGRFAFDEAARQYVLTVHGRLSQAAAAALVAALSVPSGCRAEVFPSGVGFGGVPDSTGGIRIYSDGALEPRADEIRAALETHLRVQ